MVICEEPKDLNQLILELDNMVSKHYKNPKNSESESQGFIKPMGFGDKQKKHTLLFYGRDDQPKRRIIVVQKKVFLN